MTITFEEGYARWYRPVVRSAWSICRDVAQAEELAQDAFVRAYRRWSRIEKGGYAEAWLHRAVMNLALTAIRRRRRGRELEELAAASPFAPTALGPEGLDGELVGMLRSLPTRQREAVFLRVVADLPEEVVATLMGCSPGSVKVHKKRGLDRLRAMYEGGHDVADTRATAALER